MSTTAIASSTPTIQQLGLGSSLDVTSIVNALVSEAQIPETQLANQVTSDQTELSSYGQLSSALSSFQSSLAALNSGSVFQSLQASVADSSIASATVSTATGTGAPSAGTHTLQVSQLAQNQVIASSDFSSTTSTVGTGSITIQLGTWSADGSTFTPSTTTAAKTITVGSANSSLTGIVQAINAGSAGVSASIINDGSGSRLVLSGASTGAAQGFRVTVADSDGNDTDTTGLSAIAFDPTASGGTPQSTLLQSSQNANFTVDGIAITNSSNTVSDAIQGVTLNLLQTTTTPTTLAVTQSTAAANTAIQGFVAAYNSVQSTVSSLASYNASTSTAGPLNGDPSVSLIESDLQNIVATTFSTGNPNIQSVADLGISFQEDGTLALNQTTLNNALSSDPAAVGQLFATTGTATDSLVNYQGSTSSTQPGTYPLTVTQLATQGSLAGTTAAGLDITAGANDTLNLTIDGVSSAVTIPAANYATADDLAAAVQSAINSSSAFTQAGIAVNATNSGGTLSIADSVYGSDSSVLVTGGNGAAGLLGANPTAAAGLDVAGTLDGVAFQGQGQVATGAAGTAAAGLAVTIAGGSTGSRGSVSFSQGIAAQLGSTLTTYLDPTNGIIASATSGINASITSLQAQEQTMLTNIQALQANLEAQFTAMDQLVASLNSTSEFLNQELGSGSSSSSSSSTSPSASAGSTVTTNA